MILQISEREKIMKFKNILIQRTVRNRIQKWNRNKLVLHHYNMDDFHSAMKEMHPIQMKLKQSCKTKHWNMIDAFGNYSVSFHLGYRYGVLLADSLLKEKNFNLISLIESVKKIPLTETYWNCNSATGYMDGFISGIFGEDDFGENETNTKMVKNSISEWKQELHKEATLARNQKEKELEKVSLIA